MAGYEIGISGLHAAQQALEIIGNNIANAATKGYHRQEIILRPASEAYSNGQMVGQGVDFQGIRRMVDQTLDDEILRQQSSLSELDRQLQTLKSLESAFGELTGSGLSTTLDTFFSAFDNLSTRPQDVNLQSAVLAAAETLTNQFRSLGEVTANMEDTMFTEAKSTVDRINQLASQIAAMNQEIYTQKMRGFDTSNSMDQRDGLIIELSQLTGISTVLRDTGMVDVTASDVSLVVGAVSTQIEIGLTSETGQHLLGLRPTGTEVYDTKISGGVLGGIFTLRNSILQELNDKLDTLAQTLISQVNRMHVQGVGLAGSFSSLTGWTMSETDVASMVPPVQAGTIYIRVTDAAGQDCRYAVNVTSDSTLESVAADIAAIPGLEDNTGVNNGRLQIVANTGYTFDFLPGVLSSPTATVPSPLAGAGSLASEAPPIISVGGIYTGTANETYTCSVTTVPPGQTFAIGTGTMELEIRNGSGVVINKVNIGQGYAPGTLNGPQEESTIVVENGIIINLKSNGAGPGYLNDGESFTIDAIANSDTSGFLAAAGINCFFSGTGAGSIEMTDYVGQDGRNIAISRGTGLEDNTNAVAIARLGQSALADLGGQSITEYYQQLSVGLGNQISITQMQYDNTDGILQSLEKQQDDISGVDVNDQASLMMLYERMFQGMAQYMNTISKTLETVMTILQ
jgi:flagellar hook-associated protein 1 FlgK